MSTPCSHERQSYVALPWRYWPTIRCIPFALNKCIDNVYAVQPYRVAKVVLSQFVVIDSRILMQL